jgi:WD40 repeat protein
MAQVQRHRRTIAAALFGLAALALAPALAQDQGSKDGTDLYDRPVLAVDPGMHTARIWAQAVDAAGRYAVTGSDDRTVRVWSVADGKVLRTIWIPVGPEYVGAIYAVAISPDGSTIAAGGWTERRNCPCSIYLFDLDSGNLIRRISDDLPNVTHFLTFSPDGRYLAATLYGGNGLRIFDRNKDWNEAVRDEPYGIDSYGATFARDGRLATASYEGMIRLYRYDPNNDRPSFRRVGDPIKAPSGQRPYRVAFSPDGNRLAIGYLDAAAVDILDGTTLSRVGGQSPEATLWPDGITTVAWSPDGGTLFAAGAVTESGLQFPLFAWGKGGVGQERLMTYCAANTVADIDILPDDRILVASMEPCLGLMNSRGEPIWTVASRVLEFNDQTDLRVSRERSE